MSRPVQSSSASPSMIVLGIETSCDETAAAVVEETATRSVRGACDRTSSRRRWPFTASGEAWCRSCRRASTCATSAASSSRRSPRPAEYLRCHCRHAGARSRRIVARGSVVRQVAGVGEIGAARARPSPGGPHRVAGPRERRDAAAGDRAGRVGRPHEPLPHRGARRATSCSAERVTMRPARRSTRSPSCSGSAIRAGRRSIALARHGNDRAVPFPKTRVTHADRNAPHLPGHRDFSFSGLKTAVLRHVAARRRDLGLARTPAAAGHGDCGYLRRAFSASSSKRCSIGSSRRLDGTALAASASPAACRRTACSEKKPQTALVDVRFRCIFQAWRSRPTMRQ